MGNLVNINLDIKIDFELLKDQKRDLINLIELNRDTDLGNNLEGILNIITEIQDYAVDELGFDENIIFDDLYDLE